MAEFRYRAFGADGAETSGTISAGDAAEARGLLRRRGLRPRALTPQAAAEAALPGAPPRDAGAGGAALLPPARLTDWATRLAAMLRGGLPLDRALAIVADAATRDGAVSRAMLAAVQSGASPADAAALTGAFDRGALGLLRAADSTGDLAGAFAAIARDSAAALDRRRTVTAALTYPALLVGFAALAMGFMLLVIIPRFQPIFAQARAAVPPGTARILAASDWLQAHVVAVAALAALLLALLVWAGRTGRLVPALAPLLRRTPGLAGLFGKLSRVQVLDRLAGFLGAGVALPEALGLAAASAADPRLATALAQAQSGVTMGAPFSEALAAQGVMDAETLALIRTGEESGALQQMLALAASTQEAAAKAALKRLLSVIEPLLILLIGAMIGGMILSIFQAVLSINDVVI